MLPGPFNQYGKEDFIGCTDTLPLHMRNDIITFETPILSKDLEITGPIYVCLWISSTAIDTDFTAKIVDVFPTSNDDPDGTYINITDSIIRTRYRDSWKNPSMMIPGEIYRIKFQLYPTSVVFQKNHKLRLDISSSNWPRFDVLHKLLQKVDQCLYSEKFSLIRQLYLQKDLTKSDQQLLMIVL